MRLSLPFALLVLLPPASFAQNKEIQDQVDQNLATIRFVQKLQHSGGGFYPGPQTTQTGAGLQPSLRATTAAARALKYLTGKPVNKCVPNVERVSEFVMACYDPKSGGFAEPGSKPDVFITSIGIMAAIELGVPKEKFGRAMGYLKANAKTFEDVRIGAAAVEAWGVKDCPFDLKPWLAIADKQLRADGTAGKGAAVARETGSVIAMKLRLGVPEAELVNENQLDDVLQAGQGPDGGYGREGAKGSDLESTYRVMRAFVLMHERPKQRAAMRGFIAKCRNADGGYAVRPGDSSTIGGVYYASIISKWLDEMEE